LQDNGEQPKEVEDARQQAAWFSVATLEDPANDGLSQEQISVGHVYSIE
jgi:hypothetical protein